MVGFQLSYRREVRYECKTLCRIAHCRPPKATPTSLKLGLANQLTYPGQNADEAIGSITQLGEHEPPPRELPSVP